MNTTYLVRFFQDSYPPDRSRFVVAKLSDNTKLTDKPLFLSTSRYDWTEVVCLDPDDGMKQIRETFLPMYRDKEYPIVGAISKNGTYEEPDSERWIL